MSYADYHEAEAARHEEQAAAVLVDMEQAPKPLPVMIGMALSQQAAAHATLAVSHRLAILAATR